MSRAWTPGLAFELVDRVGHAYSLLHARTEALVGELDLTVGEAVGLFVLLAFEEGLTQTEWGRLQAVSRQRAHALTKRLVERGLVHREVRGRASRITLTAEGRDLAGRLREHTSAVAFEQLSDLSETEALALHAGLGRLVDSLEATARR